MPPVGALVGPLLVPLGVVHERCCGLDVHKKTVVACVLLTQADGTVERKLRTFGTMTVDLLELSDWLAELGVEQIALESLVSRRRHPRG